MQVIHSINEWQSIRKSIYQNIGFIPTMGNLHAGHASLMQRATKENPISVVSIFVNPTQFNDKNDYLHYPTSLDDDLDLAGECKIDYVFAPNTEQIYPDGFNYQLSENKLSHEMEGKFRDEHFTGVLTIVLKLLNLVKPSKLYLGEKDYQQLKLIEGMIQALFLEIEVIACKTIRNADNVALSSRNNRLNQEQLNHAANFYKYLSSQLSCSEVTCKLQELGFHVDYIENKYHRRFGAVKLGEVRLIDNVELK